MGLDAIILVGGKGTRLQSVVADRPKPMALIGGRPFLDVLIERLRAAPEVDQIILATGYKSEQIREYYKGQNIVISEEKEPLGTGGAIKEALSMTRSDPLLVLNGDSYLAFDMAAFLAFHHEKGADLSLCTCEVEDASRYGLVVVDAENRVRAFIEKQECARSGLINGGVYLLKRDLLDRFSGGRFLSLEQECFPKLLDKALFSYTTAGYFIDIGTKESYFKAQSILHRKCEWC